MREKSSTCIATDAYISAVRGSRGLPAFPPTSNITFTGIAGTNSSFAESKSSSAEAPPKSQTLTGCKNQRVNFYLTISSS